MIKSVMVYGQIYKVKMIKGLSKKRGLCGYCNGETKEIGIDAHLNPNLLLVTLVHEYIEAVLMELSISQLLDEKFKDVIIDNIAKGFVDNFFVIQDDKKKKKKVKKK